MTKCISYSNAHPAHDRSIFSTVALFILLCVIALRPLVSESYEATPSSFSQVMPQIDDPTPIRTILFDLSILLATLMWLIGRTFPGIHATRNQPQAEYNPDLSGARSDANVISDSPARTNSKTFALNKISNYQKTGLEWGLLLLTIAGIISCCFAGNKRLAINATVDWLCLPVMTMALVNLLRTHSKRQLLLAVLVASACAQAAQCLEQSQIGNSEALVHYQSVKESFWSNQGITLDNPTVTLFEQRMKANEAQGFLPHSNITGSYLVLCFFLAQGSFLQKWRWSDLTKTLYRSAGLAFFITAITAAIVSTRSLGAMTSAIIGLLVMIILIRWSKLIFINKMKILYAGWASFLAATIAVIGHGLYHNTFPHMSLTFRWQYWKASAKLIREYFLTGVGRENFGRHYLQYKSIQSPEEITNPHNLFVQATSEWGLLGLAGMLAMLVGVTYLIARSDNTTPTSPLTPQHDSTHHRWWLWGISLTLVVAIVRIPMLSTTDYNFIYYTTVITTASWLLGFICMSQFATQTNTGSYDNRYITAAILAGLFAFILHDMINFAIFIPASATTFFAALALVIPASPKSSNVSSFVLPYRWFWPSATVAIIGVVSGAALIPSYQTQRCVEELRAYGKQHSQPIDKTKPPYKNIPISCYTDKLDPTPFKEIANLWLIESTLRENETTYYGYANSELREAKARDPYDISLQRLIANTAMEYAREGDSYRNYVLAAHEAAKIIELYPEDPDGIIEAAMIEAQVGTMLKDHGLIQTAVTHLQSALLLDDSRPWWERIRKLSVQQREVITANIQRLTKRAAGGI